MNRNEELEEICLCDCKKEYVSEVVVVVVAVVVVVGVAAAVGEERQEGLQSSGTLLFTKIKPRPRETFEFCQATCLHSMESEL